MPKYIVYWHLKGDSFEGRQNVEAQSESDAKYKGQKAVWERYFTDSYISRNRIIIDQVKEKKQ